MRRFIQRLLSKNKSHSESVITTKHSLSPQKISSAALFVVKTLQEKGYKAYIVGGSIRDCLLGKEPKDFDVATNAKPEQVKKAFKRCRLIGRRFRLAHVLVKGDMIEVATFRGAKKSWSKRFHTNEKGVVLRDNQFGRMDEDAWRRDFSVNALYYDPIANTIVDYVGGLEAIEKKEVRVLGDIRTRLREDPVRILRALRIHSQFDLSLDRELSSSLTREASYLGDVASSRLYEELLKTLYRGLACKQLHALAHHDVLRYLIPDLASYWHEHDAFPPMVQEGLVNTDRRIKEGLSINPAFLLSVMLWRSVKVHQEDLADNKPPRVAMAQAMDRALDDQCKATAIPKRIVAMMLEIWRMQYPLEHHRARSAKVLLGQKRFRAAYDFLLLRAHQDNHLQPIAEWWTQFQEQDQEGQANMMALLPQPKRRKRSKRRR